MATLAVAAATASASAPVPFLQVMPNPVTGSPHVTVFGQHFCGDAACSTVTITIEEVVVAEDVAVEGDGTFRHPLVLRTPPGNHRVEATQLAADGATLSAAETLTVAARDFAIDESADDEDQPPATSPDEPTDDVDASPNDDAGDEPDGEGDEDAAPQDEHTEDPAATGEADVPGTAVDADPARRSTTAWALALAVVVGMAGVAVARRSRS